MYEVRALCRTCGNKIDELLATHLFDDSTYLHIIEKISDLRIEYDNNLPEYICDKCKLTLDHITEFRVFCLSTQTKLLAAKQEMLQNVKDYILPFETVDYDELDIETVDTTKEEHIIEEAAISKPELEYATECSIEIVEFIDHETTEHVQKAELAIPKAPKRCKNKKIHKTWICEQCGGEFKNSTYLKLHLLRHTGKKDIECDVCKAKYYTQHEMLRHRILHTDARPFACRFCDKTFRSCSSKVIHERSHTNERPFQCNFCVKRFTSSSICRNHELVHLDKRKFHCETCDLWFLRSAHLVIHQRTKQHKKKAESVEAYTVHTHT